jgi:type II secretion system protein H
MSSETRLFKMKREAGFSMIELMVVAVIMAIALAASIPSLRSHTASVNLNKGADKIAASLKLARTRAVATNVPIVVEFDGDAGTYLMYQDDDEDGICDANETCAGPYDMPNRTSINSISFTNSTVTFAPSGSASETGNVVVAGREDLAKRVDVTAPTGLVYVSDIYALESTEDLR